MTIETQSLDEQIAERLDLVPPVCPGAGVWFKGWGTPATGVCDVCRQRLPLEGEPARYGGGGTMPEHRFPVPPFSTDIAQAWRVVEKMRERGFMDFSVGRTWGSAWRAHFSFDPGTEGTWSDLCATPATAICVAALAALEEEGDDNLVQDERRKSE